MTSYGPRVYEVVIGSSPPYTRPTQSRLWLSCQSWHFTCFLKHIQLHDIWKNWHCNIFCLCNIYYDMKKYGKFHQTCSVCDWHLHVDRQQVVLGKTCVLINVTNGPVCCSQGLKDKLTSVDYQQDPLAGSCVICSSYVLRRDDAMLMLKQYIVEPPFLQISCIEAQISS